MHSYSGYTHAQVLRTIRECPTTIQFKLHRSVDGNEHLLQQQEANDNIMKRKVQSEKALQAFHNEHQQGDIVAVTPETARSNISSKSAPPMVSSFEPAPPEHTVAHRFVC